jgi:ribonucleoside-triphosphate reductase
MNVPCGRIFHLDAAFLAGFAGAVPAFGFNGLGELVYRRTYSRLKEDGTREEWIDTVKRVVEGTFSMQKKWQQSISLPFDEAQAQEEAQDMFRRMFTFKFLPPGRGLWAMGTELTAERGIYAALNNCCFVSTEPDGEKASAPYIFCMDNSMLGVGVGFDTKGEGAVRVVAPAAPVPHVVGDSREGWVKSVEVLLDAYLEGGPMPVFDYSSVRPAGQAIHGFGGVSQGPDPLIALHKDVDAILTELVGSPITCTAIVDIFNLIGRCVVAGNVRR